jgi:hypothetical protein
MTRVWIRLVGMSNDKPQSNRRIKSMDNMKTWKDFIENLDLVPDGTEMQIGDGPWVTLDSKQSKKALAEAKPISPLVQ